MKRMGLAYGVVCSLGLSLVSGSLVHAFGYHSYVSPRSQSVNAARELVGWQREINRDGKGKNYCSFSITPEYVRSFDNARLAEYLFGTTKSFIVQGSALGGCTTSNNILADYFGLPRDFQSIVSFDPIISNFLVDFDLYAGFDSVYKGFYVRVHAPLVHANWDLNLCEMVSLVGTDTFPGGYMAAEDVSRADLPLSFREAMKGTTVFGDMRDPLQYGKIFRRGVKTHISDVQLIIGENFIARNDAHVGVNLRFSLPVGSPISPEFLFDPIIGNARHCELGGGFTGHYDLWCNKTRDMIFSVYLDANVTHLFAARSLRSYNLKNNGCGSRYMLLEAMNKGSQDLFVGGTAPGYQYAQRLIPAINVTTLCSSITVPVQVDCALKLSLLRKGLAFDLGYDFWYRSAEHLVCRNQLPNGWYALKGDAQVYGFDSVTHLPVPLSATESKARLCGGQGAGNSEFTNTTVDAPGLATDGVNPLNNLTPSDALLFGIAQASVNSSNPPVVLSDADIDVCSGLAPRALTHKLFFHIGYTWHAAAPWVPYLGVGGEIEYATGDGTCTSGIRQWGAWLKGGISR